jgi:hypothetical protein
MEPKEQRKVDDFIIFAMSAADQALNDAGWHPKTPRRAEHARAYDRLRASAGIEGIAETRGDHAEGEAGRAVFRPFFIPGALINLAGAGVDHARPQGAEPRGRDRLLDRRARDRRCGAADRLRRRRRDGGGRRRVAGLPLGMAGLRRLRARSRPASTTRPSGLAAL